MIRVPETGDSDRGKKPLRDGIRFTILSTALKAGLVFKGSFPETEDTATTTDVSLRNGIKSECCNCIEGKPVYKNAASHRLETLRRRILERCQQAKSKQFPAGSSVSGTLSEAGMSFVSKPDNDRKGEKRTLYVEKGHKKGNSDIEL